ncbi:sodium:solute symporter family protein [Chitinophaga sp. NPDC101104]|uniref:sodium:solute symporter family protein n=1 Tax=Chitinophaga sp. NPDC101104 TaxID=3390561 RepID=UPI003D071E42
MKLALIDLIIIAVYLAAMVVIGLIVKKRAARNLDGYFLGGKKLPWYMLGLSDASGMFDISGTMWMVYLAFVYGLKSLWVPWLWPVFNQIFMMVYLSMWLRRSNARTGAEWIRTRFGFGNGAGLAHGVVVCYAVIGVVGFLCYGFIGVGKFIEVFLPWDMVSNYVPFHVAPEYVPHLYGIFFTSIATLYVIMGGMEGIVWADAVQFTIMTISGVTIAVTAINAVSPEALAAKVPAGWDTPFFGWELGLDWSHHIPAIMDKISGDQYGLFAIFVMMMLFKGIFFSMAGPAPSYDMQKILACRNPREASLMSASVSVFLLFPRYLMIMGFTVLAIVFFSDDFRQMGNGIDFETILPRAISQFSHAGLTGLLLASLLAAFISTFASTVNAAPAYLINDIYLRYINPKAPVKTQIRASYIISAVVVIFSTCVGFYLQNINTILQWIVSALYGGYIAANVLKWHWWRFNGFGFFWGMAAGIIAAMFVPLLFPNTLPLYYFPLMLVVSLAGCLIGTYSSPPVDEETLVEFYVRVRPWGFWGPVAAKAMARYPGLQPNRNFRRDMVNIGVGIVWQCALTLLPMYIVLQYKLSLLSTVLVLGITTLILKKNWYDKMNKESIEYDRFMATIGKSTQEQVMEKSVA